MEDRATGLNRNNIDYEFMNLKLKFTSRMQSKCLSFPPLTLCLHWGLPISTWRIFPCLPNSCLEISEDLY